VETAAQLLLQTGPSCLYQGLSPNMQPTVQPCKFMIQGGVQYIVISNALTSDYVAGSNATIQFQLFDIQLPPSEAPSGTF